VAATGVDGYFGAGGESTLDFQASMPLIWPQKPVLFQTDDQYYEGGGSNGWLNSKTRFVMLAAVPTDSAKAFLDAIDGSYCSYSAFGEKGDCIDEVCADPEYPDINAPSPIGTDQSSDTSDQ
jgi:tripeptidyl-peptidase I